MHPRSTERHHPRLTIHNADWHIHFIILLFQRSEYPLQVLYLTRTDHPTGRAALENIYILIGGFDLTANIVNYFCRKFNRHSRSYPVQRRQIHIILQRHGSTIHQPITLHRRLFRANGYRLESVLRGLQMQTLLSRWNRVASEVDKDFFPTFRQNFIRINDHSERPVTTSRSLGNKNTQSTQTTPEFVKLK